MRKTNGVDKVTDTIVLVLSALAAGLSAMLIVSEGIDVRVFILLGIAIAMWLDTLIATQFYKIAKEKGHDSVTYYRFAFWLGIVGYLMVIALPDRKHEEQVSSDELPDL